MDRAFNKPPTMRTVAHRPWRRLHSWRRACAAILLSAAACGATADAGSGARIAEPVAVRRAELVTLVRQDCGSCHGLTLKGGLGPPLTPDALRNKPALALKAVILHGQPGTPMPPWQRFLSADEADWIVANLQKGFPDDR